MQEVQGEQQQMMQQEQELAMANQASKFAQIDQQAEAQQAAADTPT